MTPPEMPMSTVGVLLAAGRGRRMGTLKQLLPWGAESTLVASSFDAVARLADSGMVVVLGAEADAVAAALSNRSFQRVESDPDSEMWVSVTRGIESALEIPGVTHLLLHPADHPSIPAGVVQVMMNEATDEAAILPTFQGKGGHPVLIPVAITNAILNWPGVGGLRAFWEAHPALIVRREFSDAQAMRHDIDTPEDYRRLRGSCEDPSAGSSHNIS